MTGQETRRIARAAALYAAALLAAGFALGTLRVLALAPRVGEVAAVALELPLMLGLAWLVAARLRRSRTGPGTGGALLGMGALAVVLLLCAEAGLAAGMFGQTVAGFLAGLATPHGLLGLAGQMVSGIIPWLENRARG